MKMRRLRLAFAALLVAIPALAGGTETPSYTVTMLYGTTGNPAVQATAIANNGNIAGTCSAGAPNAKSYMFLYTNGYFRTLPDAPNAASNSTIPFGINTAGWIA
jgi:hypothetical protein